MSYKNEGTVTINHSGKEVTCSWKVERSMVTVSGPIMLPPKTTQLGGSPPETLARLMCGELYDEAERRGLPKG